LFNDLQLNFKISRNYTNGSKPAFKEHIGAQFFYCEREFTSIYNKCTRFPASAKMYMRSALLYSTLRNITLEHRRPKRTFSSVALWWSAIVTFS